MTDGRPFFRLAGRPGRGRVWVLAVFLLGPAFPGSAAVPTPEPRQQLLRFKQSIREQRQDLNSIRQKAAREKQSIARKQRQQRSLLRELQGLEKRLQAAEDQYEEDQQNLALLRGSLGSVQNVIRANERSIEELKEQLSRRLRVLYREGGRGPWLTLFGARTFAEAASRLKFLRALAAQNAYWIESLQKKQQQLQEQRQDLARRERQARELEDSSRRTLASVTVQRRERAKFLLRLKEDQAEHEQALKELESASEELTRLMRRLQHQATALERSLERTGDTFAQRQGRLAWPTRGRVVGRFGRAKHPRFDTYVLHKGIDIAGTIRQNVVSVAPGNVLFAQWFEGFGRMIILDHGHGYNTVYAHLERITVNEGQNVSENQVIGLLGDSGSWKGPALYFEIRRRGEAQDPMRWLGR